MYLVMIVKFYNLIESRYLRILTGKKHPQNKTPTLSKSMDMAILVIRTSNQLFVRGS